MTCFKEVNDKNKRFKDKRTEKCVFVLPASGSLPESELAVVINYI